MAAVNPSTGHYEGAHHGEADPHDAHDLWCAGCRAWTRDHWWIKHAWHHPPTPTT